MTPQYGHPVGFGTNNGYWVGLDGQTSVTVAASIAATLAAMPAGNDADWLLLNLGANDFVATTNQTDYETAMGQILDAAKAKWPNLQAKVTLPWRSGYDAQAATMATWVANVVSTRSTWASIGTDEATWLPANTDDGVHPNSAGYAVMATKECQSLGYCP